MSNPKPVVEPVAHTTELAVGSNTSEQPAVVFVWPKKSPSGSIDAEAAGEAHHIGDEIIQRPRSPLTPPRPQRSDSSNWDSSSDAEDRYPPLYAVKMLISFFTFGAASDTSTTVHDEWSVEVLASKKVKALRKILRDQLASTDDGCIDKLHCITKILRLRQAGVNPMPGSTEHKGKKRTMRNEKGLIVFHGVDLGPFYVEHPALRPVIKKWSLKGLCRQYPDLLRWTEAPKVSDNVVEILGGATHALGLFPPVLQGAGVARGRATPPFGAYQPSPSPTSPQMMGTRPLTPQHTPVSPVFPIMYNPLVPGMVTQPPYGYGMQPPQHMMQPPMMPIHNYSSGGGGGAPVFYPISSPGPGIGPSGNDAYVQIPVPAPVSPVLINVPLPLPIHKDAFHVPVPVPLAMPVPVPVPLSVPLPLPVPVPGPVPLPGPVPDPRVAQYPASRASSDGVSGDDIYSESACVAKTVHSSPSKQQADPDASGHGILPASPSVADVMGGGRIATMPMPQSPPPLGSTGGFAGWRIGMGPSPPPGGGRYNPGYFGLPPAPPDSWASRGTTLSPPLTHPTNMPEYDHPAYDSSIYTAGLPSPGLSPEEPDSWANPGNALSPSLTHPSNMPGYDHPAYDSSIYNGGLPSPMLLQPPPYAGHNGNMNIETAAPYTLRPLPQYSPANPSNVVQPAGAWANPVTIPAEQATHSSTTPKSKQNRLPKEWNKYQHNPALGQPLSETTGDYNPKQLFVSRLGEHIDELGIRRIFEPYGRIAHGVDGVKLIRDRNTQVSKKYAFVTFEDSSTVDKVLSQTERLIKFSKIGSMDIKRSRNKMGATMHVKIPTPPKKLTGGDDEFIKLSVLFAG